MWLGLKILLCKIESESCICKVIYKINNKTNFLLKEILIVNIFVILFTRKNSFCFIIIFQLLSAPLLYFFRYICSTIYYLFVPSETKDGKGVVLSRGGKGWILSCGNYHCRRVNDMVMRNFNELCRLQRKSCTTEVRN